MTDPTTETVEHKVTHERDADGCFVGTCPCGYAQEAWYPIAAQVGAIQHERGLPSEPGW